MDLNKALVVFQGKKIRRTWFNDEWWFSVVDIVEALTESGRARKYWSDLKKRLTEEGFELSAKIGQLKLVSTEITRKEDAQGYEEVEGAAKRGGRVAGKYDKRYEEIERVGDFIDISSKLRFWGRFINVVSFGEYGNFLLKEVNQYAERHVAWRTLEQTADRMYKEFKDDVAYLADGGDNDLSRQLDNVRGALQCTSFFLVNDNSKSI